MAVFWNHFSFKNSARSWILPYYGIWIYQKCVQIIPITCSSNQKTPDPWFTGNFLRGVSCWFILTSTLCQSHNRGVCTLCLSDTRRTFECLYFCVTHYLHHNLEGQYGWLITIHYNTREGSNRDVTFTREDYRSVCTDVTHIIDTRCVAHRKLCNATHRNYPNNAPFFFSLEMDGFRNLRLFKGWGLSPAFFCSCRNIHGTFVIQYTFFFVLDKALFLRHLEKYETPHKGTPKTRQFNLLTYGSSLVR